MIYLHTVILVNINIMNDRLNIQVTFRFGGDVKLQRARWKATEMNSETKERIK